MALKIILLLAAFGGMLACDAPKLRQAGRWDQVLYGLWVSAALYLGIDFLIETKLPHLDELLDLTLTEPAKRISELLKANP